MSIPIAFVDVETTHLDASIGVAWEVAVILREFEDGQHTDTEYVWQIRPNLTNADPEALKVGRFEERFAVPEGAEAAWTADESGHVAPMTRAEAVTAIVNVLRGAVIVGSNPAFDDRHLRRLVGRGRAQWHYRPYDIVQLAAAKLGVQAVGPLPWPTHPMSRAVGVEPPSKDVAHTALGDARWARDVHDAAMVREQIPLSWEGRAQHAISLYTQTAIELEDAERERDRLRQILHLLRSGLAHAQSAAYVVKLAKQAEAAVAQAPGTDGQPSDAAALWPSAVRSVLDGPSQPVMTGHHHYGRAWTGHEIEDACPCIKAPCGLVAQSVPWCTQHRADKSTRQSHPADSCPGPDQTVALPRTERERWVAIANALNAAHAAGMPVGIDLDGTLTDHRAWSVIWDPAAERWEVAGYDDGGEVTPCTCTFAERCAQHVDDQDDDELLVPYEGEHGYPDGEAPDA
ncbi:hypothetical protein ACFWWC_03680 [Streptomyces sp. NPDC058642]|uniref:3'-5' exonuclease n=1 Tax=Streptomyces sp. NPDC058642 TaxID=3346572 RepID=UPI00364EC516